MLTRRAILASSSLALASPAIAQNTWPSGPIRLIAPFPPGGSVDAICRLIQPHLTASLGVPVVVENRSGASGSIGTREVARATPDGNSWVLVFDTHAVNQALIPNMGFDTQRDLAPVLLIGTAPMVVTAHRTRPWQSFAEMVAAAKAKPDTISYGTIGNGSLAHLTMKLIEREAGISLIHIPYRGGGPLVLAANTGEVDLPMATASVFMPPLQSGAIRALASTSADRSSVAPDAPTLTELGIPVTADAFWGLLGTAGTPAPILARFEAAAREAFAQPAVRERLTGPLGIDLDPKGPEEFGRFLATSMETWAKVVRDNNIRAD
jgi:tripartite-type tricarboxylate transporter receptor subunit TctC